MLRITVNSYKAFQKKASTIQRNELLPVLSNVKVTYDGSVCTITKNSMNSICVGQVEIEGDCEPGSFLIDEQLLNDCVPRFKTTSFCVENEGELTIIRSGETKIELPKINPADFPDPPDYGESPDCFPFNSDHLRAIKIASNFTHQSETAGPFQFVHLSEQYIFAFNPFFFYINSSFEGIPKISMRPEEIVAISSYDSIEFTDLPNYHVYFAPGYTYYFSKTESNQPNVSVVFERLAKPGKDCKMNGQQFIDFCLLANSVSGSPKANCVIRAEGMFAKMKLNDASYSRKAEDTIMITGELDEFSFDGKAMITPLRSVPSGEWDVNTKQNCFIINGRESKEVFCFIGMNQVVNK